MGDVNDDDDDDGDISRAECDARLSSLWVSTTETEAEAVTGTVAGQRAVAEWASVGANSAPIARSIVLSSLFTNHDDHNFVRAEENELQPRSHTSRLIHFRLGKMSKSRPDSVHADVRRIRLVADGFDPDIAERVSGLAATLDEYAAILAANQDAR